MSTFAHAEAIVTVTLAGALVDLFPGCRATMPIEAATVVGLIDRLDVLYPGIADRIRDERPAIRRHINVFVDGDKATLESPLRSGSRVHILTAISGG